LCFALIASGTRGAWLAMLAPVVIALFIWLRYKAKSLTAWPLIAYALVIVLFILSPFISAGLNLVRTINSDDNFLKRASSIYDLNESSNVGRLEIWRSSAVYALHHPLGTGYGNFIASISMNSDNNVTSYEQLAEQKNLRFNLPQKFITAHSLYLHILVELGLLGLLIFGLMWLSFFAKIWRYLKSEKWQANQNSLLLFNIGLALVWLLAYGLFDVTILNERVLLYLMVIIAVVNILLTNKLETKN
jgi:O-antigen ligase